jgi:tetratricopeptide (TPR) repeat protein
VGLIQVQVGGQVAVMKINGLLCKVIFDHNPGNEFYVEESFPLDWMFPYETPFGIIMKINRQVVPSFSPEVFKKDHEFWSQYSARLIGNWITYTTSVKQIADFAEKVYMHRDSSGFQGSQKFIRDEHAQQAFSKLRSSIAGLYAWRLGALSPVPTPPEFLPQTETERQELIQEADFAFKQAFAFCPYSAEVVFRYITLLVMLNRYDDAITVAQTCSDFDPYNTQVANMVKQLKAMKKESAGRAQFETELQHMEDEARTNPTNFQNIFNLASIYFQMRQTGRVIELFDRALASPHISPNEIAVIAQFYAQTGNLPKLEGALEKMVAVAPNEPEPWCDLAAIKIALGKTNESLQDLRTSLELNAKRLKQNPKAHDLLDEVRKDRRLNALHSLPEFQQLVSPNN